MKKVSFLIFCSLLGCGTEEGEPQIEGDYFVAINSDCEIALSLQDNNSYIVQTGCRAYGVNTDALVEIEAGRYEYKNDSLSFFPDSASCSSSQRDEDWYEPYKMFVSFLDESGIGLYDDEVSVILERFELTKNNAASVVVLGCWIDEEPGGRFVRTPLHRVK